MQGREPVTVCSVDDRLEPNREREANRKGGDGESEETGEGAGGEEEFEEEESVHECWGRVHLQSTKPCVEFWAAEQTVHPLTFEGSMSVFTVGRSPDRTAACSGVSPVPALCFDATPCDSRYATVACCPARAAVCRR